MEAVAAAMGKPGATREEAGEAEAGVLGVALETPRPPSAEREQGGPSSAAAAGALRITANCVITRVSTVSAMNCTASAISTLVPPAWLPPSGPDAPTN